MVLCYLYIFLLLSCTFECICYYSRLAQDGTVTSDFLAYCDNLTYAYFVLLLDIGFYSNAWGGERGKGKAKDLVILLGLPKAQLHYTPEQCLQGYWH